MRQKIVCVPPARLQAQKEIPKPQPPLDPEQLRRRWLSEKQSQS